MGRYRDHENENGGFLTMRTTRADHPHRDSVKRLHGALRTLVR